MPSETWNWLYNFTDEKFRTDSGFIWKVNLDEDLYYWADMEEDCQNKFEEMYEPNTQMDPIRVTSEIGGKPCEFMFDLN